MSDTLIIPDVHGRTFWKDAVRRHPDADTIFLGDYHDPYPQENISKEASLDNFREIIDYSREHDNCHLLLGNHDTHYLCDSGEGDRLDYLHYDTLRQMLLDNLPFMAIATTREIGGKTVLFSHAPILSRWIESVGVTDHLPTLVNYLNSLVDKISTAPEEIEKMLAHTSDYRGGYDPAGSPVWADVREIDSYNTLPQSADYCIFGHTQLIEAAITPTWAELDCRHAFILTPDLKLTKA